MDDNNNVVVISEDKIATGHAEQEEKVIFNHPGGKVRSEVWKTFGFYKKKPGPGPATRDFLDMTRAVCGLCKKEYMNKGNTTNLQWHIDHDHNVNVTAKPRPIATASGQLRQPGAARTVQSTLTSSMVDTKISRARQTSLDDALLKLLVGKVLPLSLVDNPLFHRFVNLLDARYKIPSRTTVTRALERKHTEIRELVKSDVKSCQDIAITHDGGTSCNTESYSCVTTHFITVDWELVNAVLQTKKRGR